MSAPRDYLTIWVSCAPVHWNSDLYVVPGGDTGCRTGNGITARSGPTGQCGLLGLLFHFLCDILHPHLHAAPGNLYILHMVNILLALNDPL